MHTKCAIALLATTLGSAASCGRTEEPEAMPRREPSQPSSATVSRPPPSVLKQQPDCVVESPAEPPPAAQPAANCPKPSSGNFDLPRGSVTFPGAPGAPHVSVELARTDPHRARGLMFRTELASSAGMLFSWPDERIRSFWMRNTCIPLDMLFIAADGTIVGILEQVPTLNDDSRRIPCPAAHVLEVNAGWSRAHGVRAGQKVVIKDDA